jgi:tetrapyrrole methylase family protein/MazG family protein
MFFKPMNEPAILLVGLGPGNPALLTAQARWLLDTSQELYARTRRHPALATLPATVKPHGFDDLEQSGLPLEQIVDHIAGEIIALGQRPQGVVYAVPGHPLVADATCAAILLRAAEKKIKVMVIFGASLVDGILSTPGLPPASQFTVLDALALVGKHAPTFSTGTAVLITQVSSPRIAAELQRVLLALYPPTHPLYWLGEQDGHPHAIPLLLAELERWGEGSQPASLYLPELGATTSFEEFLEIIAHLRAPDGCPWDREQTHQSLRTHLLEETYEVLATLDANDTASMREEFGDLLLQVVLHAQIAAEAGEFNIADVLQSIHTKIVRRHPHVFGDLDLKDAQGVLRNWERLKAQERQANGKTEASLLDGVGSALPALLQAEQYQRRAAHVGFDWPDIRGVLDKLEEELQEVHAAGNDRERYNEIGDLLFAVVNLARWYKVEPESALREANGRFRNRFAYIEQQAREQGRTISDLTLDEMEALWQAAKRRNL